VVPFGSGLGPVLDSGKEGNKLSGSVKCWEFID
jgi:hypothetical protein